MSEEREFGMGMIIVLPAAEIVAELSDMLPAALATVMPISTDIGGDAAWTEYVVAQLTDAQSELQQHIDYCLMRAIAEHMQVKIVPFLPYRRKYFSRTGRGVETDPVAIALYGMAESKIAAYLKSFGEVEPGDLGFGDEDEKKVKTLSFVRMKAGIYLIPTLIAFPEHDLMVETKTINDALPPQKTKPVNKAGENVIAFPKKKVKPKPPPKKPK